MLGGLTMLRAGSVVTAVLGVNEEGAQRITFGKLVANEIYRVSGVIMGHSYVERKPTEEEVKMKLEEGYLASDDSRVREYFPYVKSVRLAGEQSYWPASLFVEMSEEEIETIRAKVAEAQSVGAVMHPKLVRALALPERSERLKGVTEDGTAGVRLEVVENALAIA
jgi:hypothetical protein